MVIMCGFGEMSLYVKNRKLGRNGVACEMESDLKMMMVGECTIVKYK